MSPDLISLSLHAALLSLLCGPAFAQQGYPNKPIQFIVAFGPGGPTDSLARLIAQKFTEKWGQQVVVNNRPGAHGILGTDLTAKAKPDGYTLIMITAGHAINASLYPKLPYDSVRDFAPVSLAAASPLIVVVHPSLPVRSIKELIALAKAKPGQLNYASAGTGGPPHLAVELFKSMVGIDMAHVPYDSAPRFTISVISGETQLAFSNTFGAIPHVKSGKLRALAVTSIDRATIVPEVPTMRESGVPGYEAITWYGVLAPAKTSSAILVLLSDDIKKIMGSPDVKEMLFRLGVDPVTSTPEEFSKYIRDEIEKWGKVIRVSGTKADG